MILFFGWGIAGAAIASIIYIPAVFILQKILGITGLAWAQPVADLLSTALVVVLYLITLRKMEHGTEMEIVVTGQSV